MEARRTKEIRSLEGNVVEEGVVVVGAASIEKVETVRPSIVVGVVVGVCF